MYVFAFALYMSINLYFTFLSFDIFSSTFKIQTTSDMLSKRQKTYPIFLCNKIVKRRNKLFLLNSYFKNSIYGIENFNEKPKGIKYS